MRYILIGGCEASGVKVHSILGSGTARQGLIHCLLPEVCHGPRVRTFYWLGTRTRGT